MFLYYVWLQCEAHYAGDKKYIYTSLCDSSSCPFLGTETSACSDKWFVYVHCNIAETDPTAKYQLIEVGRYAVHQNWKRISKIMGRQYEESVLTTKNISYIYPTKSTQNELASKTYSLANTLNS